MALVALALAGSLAVAGCGSSAVSLDPVAKAADKTTSQGSEHVAFTGDVSVAGQTMTMSGSGDFQNDPKLGQMTMTMDGAGQKTSVAAVLQGWTIYVKSPLFSSHLPQGKSWLSIDVQKAGQKLGVDVTQFTQESPADALAALKKAGSVTKVGTERIDGEPTTHYKATIDLSKLPSGAAAAKLTHLTSVPVDVWIGSDGLLRRLRETFSQKVNGQTTTQAMTMSLSNYGEQVNVQVPPADQTIDMTNLGG